MGGYELWITTVITKGGTIGWKETLQLQKGALLGGNEL